MAELDRQIITIANQWAKNNIAFAIALVTKSWGSSPRQAGALMLIAKDGQLAGSVSGGCVESDVINAAQDCLADRRMADLSFGISDERAWSNGLSCGGNIDVLIVPQTDAFLSKRQLFDINAHYENRTTGTLAINTATGQCHLSSEADNADDKDDKTPSAKRPIIPFTITPARQLIIIGANHIAQHLTMLADQVGFDVVVIDPRDDFITKTRFPIGTRKAHWPDDCLAPDDCDANSAVITLTHNPVIDDQALTIAMASKARHIAALGSQKTHAKRLLRLSEAGFDDTSLQRIKGPAGLPIGSATPAEIALSILAEVVAAFRGRLPWQE
ncbi:MAG: XdhC family protein [Candidatus Puniceispirillaceae bacterium]